jgi:hypothetical protein
MYLAAAEKRFDLIEAPREKSRCSARWQDFPHSALAHHGEGCCDVAREWVLAMDFAQLNGSDLASGPRWMRQKYKWGPTAWPIHWCDAVSRDTLDCGAHAALAQEAFTARGLTSFPAQFVQQYSKDATSQWLKKWTDDDVSCHWIDGDVIYHEGVALLVDGDEEIKLWDASAGWWINPRQQPQGYGSLLAVRVFAQGQFGGGDGLRWGEHRIQPGVWHEF